MMLLAISIDSISHERALDPSNSSSEYSRMHLFHSTPYHKTLSRRESDFARLEQLLREVSECTEQNRSEDLRKMQRLVDLGIMGEFGSCGRRCLSSAIFPLSICCLILMLNIYSYSQPHSPFIIYLIPIPSYLPLHSESLWPAHTRPLILDLYAFSQLLHILVRLSSIPSLSASAQASANPLPYKSTVCLSGGDIKLILWFVAAVDEDMPIKGNFEDKGRSAVKFYSYTDVMERLTLRMDRDMAKRALGLVTDTYHGWNNCAKLEGVAWRGG